MKKLLLAVLFTTLVSPIFGATGAYLPTDAERARWTMEDMNSWRICFGAYKADHGTYPEVKSAEEARAAFEPVYIARLPLTDAWGRPYAVESGTERFTVVSAGADGKLDRQSWTAGGALQSFDEDAVATNEGRWLFRHWNMK
jgi:Type II secretion system (T2SS), protein G